MATCSSNRIRCTSRRSRLPVRTDLHAVVRISVRNLQHRFERIQKFSDPLVEVCPSCGKGPVRKLISSPAIQFKGSGWYITDYAKKSSSDGGLDGQQRGCCRQEVRQRQERQKRKERIGKQVGHVLDERRTAGKYDEVRLVGDRIVPV